MLLGKKGTDSQNNYCNPRCACAPRVNNNSNNNNYRNNDINISLDAEHYDSFLLTHSYGNCVPFDTSTLPSRTPCDDLFQQGVDYVYIPYTRTGGDLRSYLRFLVDIDIAFQLAPDRCKREAQLILCHYFLPPCGNSTVFEPPTSVCKDVCNYLRNLCPVEYEFMLEYFQQQPSLSQAGLTFINCSNTGEYIEPLPHCCSDVGIDIRKSLKLSLLLN